MSNVSPAPTASAGQTKNGESRAPAPPAAATRGFKAWLWEWVKSIGVALVVWLFLRTFLLEAFHIPSGSMEKTLLVGDVLFVNKAVFGAEVPFTGKRLPAFREPERGDILVFDSVEDEGLKVVKRLIGIPGDTLAMEQGVLIRNGQKVGEPYALHANPQWLGDPAQQEQMRAWQVRYLAGKKADNYRPDSQNWGPIVVPADSFFMMGDNRDSSYDGRFWGFLPRKNVRGTPLVIYYSYNPQGWRPLPIFTEIRWGRLLTRPH